jgi:lipoprotein-anchoring transpeptidase ErfK/SrfK
MNECVEARDSDLRFAVGVLFMSGVGLAQRRSTVIVGAAFVALFASSWSTAAWSQSLFGGLFDRDRTPLGQPASYGQAPQAAASRADDEMIAPFLQRQIVAYPNKEPAGTVIVDTPHTFLYLTLGDGKALRYGIGVGRKGFTWSGIEHISRKSEWPDWTPPTEMIARQPYLPRWVGGGPGNPLGARALYLGSTDYRIHGTNDPASIGTQVSSGCIRLRNADVIDLYRRVSIGTKVIVLRGDPHALASDSPVDARPGFAVAHNGAGVMAARFSVGAHDMSAATADGSWSQNPSARSLY